jgi:hypothetical protein
MRALAPLLFLFASAAPAAAQTFPDAQGRIAAQKQALEHFKPFHGRWRGEAIIHSQAGKRTLVQTERVGPLLDGATLLVEGRGYAPDGKLVFNAFGQIVYDPGTKFYSFQTQAMGYSGVAAVKLIPDGYIWESPAGPGAVMRYTTTLKDGRLARGRRTRGRKRSAHADFRDDAETDRRHAMAGGPIRCR